MPLLKHLARGEYVLPGKVDVTPAKGADAPTPPGASAPSQVPLERSRAGTHPADPDLPPTPTEGRPLLARWKVTMKGPCSQKFLVRARIQATFPWGTRGSKGKGKGREKALWKGEMSTSASALRGQTGLPAPWGSRKGFRPGLGWHSPIPRPERAAPPARLEKRAGRVGRREEPEEQREEEGRG